MNFSSRSPAVCAQNWTLGPVFGTPAELMCTNSRCGRLFVDVAGLRPLSGTRFCLVTHAAATKCGPIHRPAQSKHCRLMFSAHAPRINLSLPTTTLPTASHDLWLTSSVTTVEELGSEKFFRPFKLGRKVFPRFPRKIEEIRGNRGNRGKKGFVKDGP